MPQTSIEKLASLFAVDSTSGGGGELPPAERSRIVAGDIIAVRPRHIMTHDNTGAVIPKFKEIGATRIFNPRQPVFAIDHDIQNITPENLGKYAKIEKFARENNIDFYPAGRGIAHQVMIEEGYVTPGSMVVGSDSHSNIYGALACLGTPVVRTDAAAIWATGQTWWQVPEQARVTLTGALRPGVTGKDVIIALCGLFNNDEALNFAVEFVGDGVKSLSMEERMTIANMTTEWGTLVGMFPFDETLRDWLFTRAEFFALRAANFSSRGAMTTDPARAEARGSGARIPYTRADIERWWANRASFAPDADAHYAKDLSLDLSHIVPHVAGPNEVKIITPLPEIEAKRVRINKAFLMSCVNARTSDLAEAARVLKGKKVAQGVEFYLAAASSDVQSESEKRGDWQALIDAGAIVLPAGCGACIGLGRGTLNAGEVGISSTNRNFEGRMGSRDAACYLASPAVVAASALAGYISSPTKFGGPALRAGFSLAEHPRPAASGGRAVHIREGFPKRVAGRALYLPKDNLNTDGIYGKEFTYKDNLPPAEMAAACMLNYDPKWQGLAKTGDILIGARNFGCGSSREQAATALVHRGVRMVIAASFSQTYARNAYNNGFMVIECPSLIDALGAKYASDVKAGTRTIVGPEITVDFERSIVTLDAREHAFPPLSPVAQDLVIAGGSENVVKKQLAGAA